MSSYYIAIYYDSLARAGLSFYIPLAQGSFEVASYVIPREEKKTLVLFVIRFQLDLHKVEMEKFMLRTWNVSFFFGRVR